MQFLPWYSHCLEEFLISGKDYKQMLLFLSCSKWETKPKNSCTRLYQASNRTPFLVNPILNCTFTPFLTFKPKNIF